MARLFPESGRPGGRLLLFFCFLLLPFASCRRPVEQGPPGREATVFATWYEVPADSLARRRAGFAELTAASDRLELGARVRVTRLSNGKSVLVRITDSGLPADKAGIDLCKEAAAELGMVRDGVARVRVEVLSPEPD